MRDSRLQTTIWTMSLTQIEPGERPLSISKHTVRYLVPAKCENHNIARIMLNTFF